MSNSNSDILEYLNQFFEKIYVITLNRNEHRQEHIQEKLNALNFSFFKGYDGQKLDIKKLEKDGVYDKEAFIKKRWDHTEPSANKIGCALSHLSVCEDIVKNNYNSALIFEDDIEVLENNLSDLENALKELPRDWELIYLGYHHNETMPLSFKIKLLSYFRLYNFFIKKKYNLRELKCHYPRTYSQHLQYAGRHYGGYAYGLSQSGAQKYIDLQKPIIQENDHTLGELCYKKHVKAFIIKEQIIKPNSNFHSSIGSRFKNISSGFVDTNDSEKSGITTKK